ncbi:MAG: patatin-like phospholipase family protein [Blastocatellia bacterium]|nr:patatin-like phospholipase family protein [Blastocatellia bacterium]
MGAARSDGRPTIAVVTGSGGLKTFGATALYEFLDEEGIAPDLLVGCSGGALLTGLLATGYNAQQMLDLIPEMIRPELFSAIDYRSLLGIPRLPFGRFDLAHGILKDDNMRAAHRRVLGDAQLEDLRPTTVIHATDFHTGEGVFLERGSLADAVSASAAFFPALPMIEWEGRWLTDGAYSSPCPVLEAVRRNIDIIIAVSIETRFGTEPKSWLDMFNLSQYLCSNTLIRNQMATAIRMHHYEIIQIHLRFERPVEFYEFDAIPLVLETGRKAVAARKDAIRAAIANFPGVSEE